VAARSITASMLYDWVQCPHRVSMDLFGDPSKRDEPNAFVQLLWERGALYEQELIEKLELPFLDLSDYSPDEREQLTAEAMNRGESLIYSGRIRTDNLLGDPDLLRREDTGYVAVDIKSGAGEEGAGDDKKLKKHYAVQLALYTDILERQGRSAGRRAFIWDVHGQEVIYDFTLAQGPRTPATLWDIYESALSMAQAVMAKESGTLPASAAACKQCHWYNACKAAIHDADDLTKIPELGRAKRDVMHAVIPTVAEFAAANPGDYINGKKTDFPGIGATSLLRFHDRANLLADDSPQAYLRQAVNFPEHECELFFDIEVDPMRDVCYLHGFVERINGDNASERFIYTFAAEPTPESEKEAFAQAIAIFEARRPCAIYYYSKYERTIYRALQKKYPDVCSGEYIEELFHPAHAVDLYFDVVKKHSEWPTWDHSIKTLASHLGFDWRDTNPSGAASIEWFDHWVKSGDEAIKQRILDYNEDDCIATRVLRDGVSKLPVK